MSRKEEGEEEKKFSLHFLPSAEMTETLFPYLKNNIIDQNDKIFEPGVWYSDPTFWKLDSNFVIGLRKWEARVISVRW